MTAWQQVVNDTGGFSPSEKATFIRIISAMPKNCKKDVVGTLALPDIQPSIIESIIRQELDAGVLPIPKPETLLGCTHDTAAMHHHA
jgi:hypothetical protein